MLSLEPEIREAAARGALNMERAAHLTAIERGEVFPIRAELHAAAYLGVALVATGLGALLEKNVDALGPVTIVAAIAIAAAGCFWPALRALRKGEPRTTIADYVLLLAGLLIAADLAYAETQFHMLGARWVHHLLIVAVLHAALAYRFDSRLLLSASLASLAGWFGFQPALMTILDGESGAAAGGLTAAFVIFLWREGDRRILRKRVREAGSGDDEGFTATFDFFIANVSLVSAVILSANRETRVAGVILAVIFSTLSVAWGARNREISYVVYGVIYGLIAIDIGVSAGIGDAAFVSLWILLTTPLAALVLLVAYQKMRRAR